MLVVSILAPSIEALCKADNDSIVVMDFNEEENNKKESEKKLDQKELFLSKYMESRSLHVGQKNTGIQTCLLTYSDFLSEIVLPPPQGLI